MSFLERLTRRIRHEAEGAAREIARATQQRLSSPSPPASRPGEHPHRRTGELQRGIDSDVRVEGENIVMEWTSAAPYTGPLERSHRPVLSHIPAEFTPMIRARIERIGDDA